MAQQTLPSGLWPPLFEMATFTGAVLDASGEKLGLICYAGKAGNLHKVHFRTVTVTTGDTIQASLQDVDLATGMPDETADQSGTVVVADGDDNTWKTVTLGADRTVAEGDLLAVVFEYSAYVAGNLSITLSSPNAALGSAYVAHKTGGSWAKLTSRTPVVVLEYADGSVGEVLNVFAGYPELTTVSTSTDPKEVGSRFRLPFATKAEGMVFYGRHSGDFLAALYDDTPTEITASVTYSSGISRSGGTDYPVTALFPASVALAANTWYRVTVRPTSGSSVRVYRQDFADAAHRGQVIGGPDWEWTEKSAANVWSTSQVKRASIGLVLDTFEAGEAGGGMTYWRHDRSGGMQGMGGGLSR